MMRMADYKFGLNPVYGLFDKSDIVFMHKLYKLKAGKSSHLIRSSIFL